MIYYFFTFVIVACIACCGYLWGRVNRLEITLMDEVANIAKEIVQHRKRIDEILERFDDYEAADSEAKINEAMEKRWNETLQNFLDYNPLIGKGKNE